MIKDWTIGSDAEMFVKTISDKSVFPVCGLVGGTKQKPKAMGGGGFFIQEDNVLLEFNIPVCHTPSEWVKNIRTGVTRAKASMPQTLYLDACASGNIHEGFLEIEQACVFGCEPDFNAWTRKVNPRPRVADPTFRSAAAHVHIGWENPTDEERHDLIKAADLFVSVPSILEDPDKKRRELYGKAGAFRIKPYGVEHRVLSNYWIDQGSAMVEYIYHRYASAIRFVNLKRPGEELFKEETATKIIRAINGCDTKLANELVREYGLG